MPIFTDVPLTKFEDGLLQVTLNPPTSISGWVMKFSCTKRFGSDTELWQRHASSGFYAGQSGITVNNTDQGVFTVNLREADTSGLVYGNYAVKCERLMSGCRSTLTEGFLLVTP